MLFLTYWELNENASVKDRIEAAGKLMEKGIFPPRGVNIVRWDVTPDGWGILLVEADSAAAVNDGLNVWRASQDGFFHRTRTAPAITVQEAISTTRDLLDRVG